MVSVRHYFNKLNTIQQGTTETTETAQSGTKHTKQKITTHKQEWENRLPKYGSQSDTTINSCL